MDKRTAGIMSETITPMGPIQVGKNRVLLYVARFQLEFPDEVLLLGSLVRDNDGLHFWPGACPLHVELETAQLVTRLSDDTFEVKLEFEGRWVTFEERWWILTKRTHEWVTARAAMPGLTDQELLELLEADEPDA